MALLLVLMACISAVVGGLALVWFEPRTAVPAVACLVAVVMLLVAADGVDAHGERQAQKVAAQGRAESTCDYALPIYTVTPGWFWW
ncbi:hypothetical protein ABT095_32085 [Kitasatospora sp. NPDC002227]|uniref:hypothetical protein n=1 Tax=Kitasatospora sp. NPDC002227 TaxID=3154773 RepID=UPI00332E8E84